MASRLGASASNRSLLSSPNKVTLSLRMTPGRDGTRMESRVTNGSAETLTGLDGEMLKGLSGFGLQSNDNKVFRPHSLPPATSAAVAESSPPGTGASGLGVTRLVPAFTPALVSRTA